MTIIAGFKCLDGIVVCADTQETVGNYSKRNVPKLRFEAPIGAMKVLGGYSNVALAVCGAGHGPFIDKLADEAWKSVEVTKNIDEACIAAEEAIKRTYEEFGRIYQTGMCPEAELVYAVKMESENRLFSASGPIVNEKHDYCAAGVGVHMADFLASRMYRRTLHVAQAIIVAAYVLFQTKEHVEGCGGGSHIAVLRDHGSSGLVNSENVDLITKLVQSGDSEIGEILMRYANVTISKDEFVQQSHELIAGIVTLREHEKSKLLELQRMTKEVFGMDLHDELGLPKSTDDELA
jgi:hypothetical protein